MTKRDWLIALSIAVEGGGWLLVAMGQWVVGVLLIGAGILPWATPDSRNAIASGRDRERRDDANG